MLKEIQLVVGVELVVVPGGESGEKALQFQSNLERDGLAKY